MNNPWELKTNDIRTSDSIYTFIIFCEDTHSEPIYFECFETPSIKVSAIRNQKSNMKNVVNAIDKSVLDGIFEKDINGYFCSQEGIEVWCVFDRDESNLSKNDIEFNLAIDSAKGNNLKVAWSNDSFELWILLHFIDIQYNDLNATKRTYYYDKLTEYFSSHTSPNDFLKKVKIRPNFGYKFHLKSERNFKNIVLPELLPRTETAIERAKKLCEYQYEQHDNSKKAPCTLVFELVERLIEQGQKI